MPRTTEAPFLRLLKLSNELLAAREVAALATVGTLDVTPVDIEAWSYAFGDIIADPCCDAPAPFHRVTCLEVTP